VSIRARAALLSASLALAPLTTGAKRVETKPVAPVESKGVKYSAVLNGPDQYVEATEIARGTQLWRIKVFHTYTNPWIEQDLQWVFITDLKLLGRRLFVRDERARCYSVDIGDHRVHKAACSSAFSEDGNARE